MLTTEGADVAKTHVEEPSTGLKFVVATRRRVGAVPGNPPDEVTYEGGCSCRFRTSGWPKKTMAEERIQQHLQEHATAGTDDVYEIPELADFKASVGWDVGVVDAPSLDPFPDDADDNPLLAVAPAPDTDPEA